MNEPAISLYTACCDRLSLKPHKAIAAMFGTTLVRDVERIDISSAYVGPKHARILIQLMPEFPGLRHVDLSHSTLSKESVDELCSALRNSIVQTVVLRGNPLEIVSGRMLLDTARSNPAIVSMSLDDTLLPSYVMDDIQVQLELNEMIIREKEAEQKKRVRDLTATAGGAYAEKTKQVNGANAVAAQAATPSAHAEEQIPPFSLARAPHCLSVFDGEESSNADDTEFCASSEFLRVELLHEEAVEKRAAANAPPNLSITAEDSKKQSPSSGSPAVMSPRTLAKHRASQLWRKYDANAVVSQSRGGSPVQRALFLRGVSSHTYTTSTEVQSTIKEAMKRRHKFVDDMFPHGNLHLAGLEDGEVYWVRYGDFVTSFQRHVRSSSSSNNGAGEGGVGWYMDLSRDALRQYVQSMTLLEDGPDKEAHSKKEAATSSTAGGRHHRDENDGDRGDGPPPLPPPRSSTSLAMCICSGRTPVCAGPSASSGMRWVTNAIQFIGQHEPLRLPLCTKALPDLGMYVFQFYKGPDKVQVMVDDYVPVVVTASTIASSGFAVRMLLSHHEDYADGWATLLHKAYAKLHGSFSRILCGTTTSAVQDFCGGFCAKLRWTLHEINYHHEELYGKIRRALVHRDGRATFLAGKPTARGELQRASSMAVGLDANALYHIKAVTTMESKSQPGRQFRLVQLTAPRTNLLWRGAFSPSSPEAAAHGLPPTRGNLSEFGLPAREFWMGFEEFASFFDTLYCLSHIPSLATGLRHLVESEGVTAKRSALIGSGSYHANPAFLLTTDEKSSSVLLRVSQGDRRMSRTAAAYAASHEGYSLGIQTHVFLAPESFADPSSLDDEHQLAKLSMLPESSAVASTTVVYSRDSFIEVTLHRHQPLVVVVSSTGDAVAVEVCAVGYEQFHLVSVENRLPLSRVVEGQWSGLTAAGRYALPGAMGQSYQYTLSMVLPLEAVGAATDPTVAPPAASSGTATTAITPTTATAAFSSSPPTATEVPVVIWLEQTGAMVRSIGLVGNRTVSRLAPPPPKRLSVAEIMSQTNVTAGADLIDLRFDAECSFFRQKAVGMSIVLQDDDGANSNDPKDPSKQQQKTCAAVTVLPMTWSPGEEGPYRLYCFSHFQMNVVQRNPQL